MLDPSESSKSLFELAAVDLFIDIFNVGKDILLLTRSRLLFAVIMARSLPARSIAGRGLARCVSGSSGGRDDGEGSCGCVCEAGGCAVVVVVVVVVVVAAAESW